MRRILFLLFVVLAFFWWVGRLLGAARRRGAAGQRADSGKAEPSQGRMVRDRVCNTFIPEAKALRLQAGEQEHFFCSEECRDRFLSGQKS